ncbi:hypothetical protein SLA_2665 [Streptomyces laurentii]|uniref:Uncharacterized protein n=1 Tax=Streptomyces laurentii TaxID=39478 RepID=A0A160NXN4_STRLU|nr:hypothetical protein SLA_2665 [Streptomyces laurentii]
MHSDVHLTLHRLTATELRHTADTAAPMVPSAPVRVQLGWKLVEFGLKLAVPGTSRAALAGRALSA